MEPQKPELALNQKSCYPPFVQRLRGAIYLFVEEPDRGGGPWAKVVSTSILVCIAISIVCLMLETVPELRDPEFVDLFWTMELVTTLIFTVEYLLRLWVCDVYGAGPTCGAFVRSPMNVLDLLAIMPFYIDESLGSNGKNVKALRAMRSVRLVRLFRIFKLGRYSSGMYLMGQSVRNSLQALSVLGFFLCIGVVLFSSLMFFAEKHSCPDVRRMKFEDPAGFAAYRAECRQVNGGYTADDRLCCTEHNAADDFPSIVATFWWSIVTITTVGFGDDVPRTVEGKAVACFSMLAGILLLSLPVAIVGSKFQEAYEDFEDAQAEASTEASESFRAAELKEILRAQQAGRRIPINMESLQQGNKPAVSVDKPYQSDEAVAAASGKTDDPAEEASATDKVRSAAAMGAEEKQLAMTASNEPEPHVSFGAASDEMGGPTAASKEMPRSIMKPPPLPSMTSPVTAAAAAAARPFGVTALGGSVAVPTPSVELPLLRARLLNWAGLLNRDKAAGSPKAKKKGGGSRNRTPSPAELPLKLVQRVRATCEAIQKHLRCETELNKAVKREKRAEEMVLRQINNIRRIQKLQRKQQQEGFLQSSSAATPGMSPPMGTLPGQLPGSPQPRTTPKPECDHTAKAPGIPEAQQTSTPTGGLETPTGGTWSVVSASSAGGDEVVGPSAVGGPEPPPTPDNTTPNAPPGTPQRLEGSTVSPSGLATLPPAPAPETPT